MRQDGQSSMRGCYCSVLLTLDANSDLRVRDADSTLEEARDVVLRFAADKAVRGAYVRDLDDERKPVRLREG